MNLWKGVGVLKSEEWERSQMVRQTGSFSLGSNPSGSAMSILELPLCPKCGDTKHVTDKVTRELIYVYKYVCTECRIWWAKSIGENYTVGELNDWENYTLGD